MVVAGSTLLMLPGGSKWRRVFSDLWKKKRLHGLATCCGGISLAQVPKCLLVGHGRLRLVWKESISLDGPFVDRRSPKDQLCSYFWARLAWGRMSLLRLRSPARLGVPNSRSKLSSSVDWGSKHSWFLLFVTMLFLQFWVP